MATSRRGTIIEDIIAGRESTLEPETREEYELIRLSRKFAKGGGVSSWNDLKDKPFEDNVICVKYDFAVIPSVALNDGDYCWYKISDLTPTYEELLGSRVVEKYNGEVAHDGILNSEDIKVYEDSLAGFNTSFGDYTVVYKTNEMFSVPETGVYYGCTLNNVEYLDALSVSMTYGNIKKLDGKLVSVPRYEYIETVEVGNPTLVSAPDNGYDTWVATYETCVFDMKEAKRAEFVFEFDNGHRTCPVEVVANCTNEDEEYHFTALFPFEFKLYAFDFMTDGVNDLGRIEIQEVCDFGSLPT